jgi:hypothetical protein
MSVDTCLGFVSVSYFIEDQMLQYLFLFGIIYLWGNISHFHSMNMVWAQCRIAEFMHFQCWESLENHIDQSAWNRVFLTDTPFFCCHVWQYALWKLYHESPCLLGVLYTSPTCRPCRTLKLILNKVNPLFFCLSCDDACTHACAPQFGRSSRRLSLLVWALLNWSTLKLTH